MADSFKGLQRMIPSKIGNDSERLDCGRMDGRAGRPARFRVRVAQRGSVDGWLA